MVRGQRRPRLRPPGSRPPPSGFTLVGVVVLIAVITILLLAVGPTVSTIIERDREQELIFRGKQYARAILAFQKRYGRLPNQLDELFKMKPKSIRQLWKDPMCGCDGWDPIFAGTPDATPMGQAPPPGALSTTPGQRTPTPGFGFSGSSGDLTPTPGLFQGGGVARTPTPSSIFGSSGKKVGPILGVRTKVSRQAIFKWRGRDNTYDWRFLAGDADQDNQTPIDPNSLYPNRTPSPPAASP
ncbi:MAG TPA: type II secretion system protein [Thermoanaerobaculia bacterium]